MGLECPFHDDPVSRIPRDGVPFHERSDMESPVRATGLAPASISYRETVGSKSISVRSRDCATYATGPVALKISSSNGWHYQPFAAAGTLSAARAIAEIQVAREADAYLPQSPTIAVDGDAFG